MDGYYDEYDEVALEDIEDDEIFEDDEELAGERRRGRRRAPRGARGGGYNQPRPSSRYVTQTQLQAVSTRVGNDIKRLNDADKTINSRVNASNARLDRHAKAIKKENSARKKADADLKTTLLLLSLSALIFKPKTQEITAVPDGLTGLAAGDKVLVQEDDLLRTLLPIGLTLFGSQISGLLGGLLSGGSSSSSSSGL